MENVFNLEKNLNTKLKSTAYGELYHTVDITLKYGDNNDANCINIKEIKEKYHRIAIRVEPLTKYYLFVSISNPLNAMIKRTYIRPFERLYDPLVPKFKDGLVENSFSAVVDGGIIHIPLEVLPGDRIRLALSSRNPFEAELSLDW
jgi:hypothetical protein